MQEPNDERSKDDASLDTFASYRSKTCTSGRNDAAREKTSAVYLLRVVGYGRMSRCGGSCPEKQSQAP
jgi:hypothetical protein